MFGWLKRTKTETRQAVDTPVDQLRLIHYDYLSPLTFKEAESYLPTVMGCIDLISNTLATLPVKVLRYDGTRKEVLNNHWLNPLLNNPNRYQNRFGEYIRYCCRQLLAYGNSITLITTTNGRATLEPIPWQYVQSPYRENPDTYVVSWPGAERVIVPPSQIVHVRLASDDSYIGKSPLQRAGNATALAKIVEQATQGIWRNSCKPSIALTHKEKLSPKDRQTAEEVLKEKYSGANQGAPLLLDNELVPVLIPNNAQHNQHLEQRMYGGIVQICQIFGCSPVLAAQDLRFGTYSNYAEARKQFADSTLRFYQHLFGDALTKALLSGEPDTYVNLDSDHLLQTRNERVTEMKELVEAGILDPNDANRELGYGGNAPATPPPKKEKTDG